MTWKSASAGIRGAVAALGMAVGSAVRAGEAAAQARLLGRVTDAVGRPAAGVEVVLVHQVGDSVTRVSVEAGETGGFQFDDVAPGTYRIRAAAGAATAERELTVADGDRRTVILRLTMPDPRGVRNAETRPRP